MARANPKTTTPAEPEPAAPDVVDETPAEPEPAPAAVPVTKRPDPNNNTPAGRRDRNSSTTSSDPNSY